MEAQARQDLLAERRHALEQRIRSSQAHSFGENGVGAGSTLDVIG